MRAPSSGCYLRRAFRNVTNPVSVTWRRATTSICRPRGERGLPGDRRTLALWDESDQWHAGAQVAFKGALRKAHPCPHDNLRVAGMRQCRGTAALSSGRRSAAPATRGIESPRHTNCGGLQQNAWRDYETGGPGVAGIVDHISFLVMRRLGLREAFTNDAHFRAAGFVTLFLIGASSPVREPSSSHAEATRSNKPRSIRAHMAGSHVQSVEPLALFDPGSRLLEGVGSLRMKITSAVFEAYLKCPTKCWLRATGEPASRNTYADWVQAQNATYRATETARLVPQNPLPKKEN